jgi:hypothetical protein
LKLVREQIVPFFTKQTTTKKLRKGATNRQWLFLKFLNLLGYGDNEIQIRENIPRKTSTKSLEPDESVYCLTYTRLYSPAPPPHGTTAPSGAGPLHYRGVSTTLRHTTLGRSPLDKRSSRSRDLYLIMHNAYKRQTSMPPAGFKPATPARQRPHTAALDHATPEVGHIRLYYKSVKVKR